MKTNAKRFYGLYSNFNAKLILLQIACMELLYYSGLSFFFILFDFSFGLIFHFGQFFHHSAFNTDHMYGMVDILSNFLNIPVVIGGLIYIVVKANKVLDFVSTIYIIHTIVCLFYSGFHFFNFGWFIINFTTFLITVLLGEYICIRFEQQEIKIFENIFNMAGGTLPVRKSKKEKEETDIELKEIQHH